MSKQFKTQDYFRYKKLGKRWRKPVGLQSKLRLKKGGSGMKAAIGYGTSGKPQPLMIRNERDFEKDCGHGVIIASTVGARKVAILAAKAKELDITLLNMKKVRRAMKINEGLKKRKQKKEEKKTETKEPEKEKSKTESKTEKKMGFHESVVPQLAEGKTKTYRLRDHGFKVGDVVKFENSQSTEIIGHGKITNVEHTSVGKINLKDKDHHKTYDKAEELFEAFGQHHPEKDVTPDTDVWVYTYEFIPEKEAKKK